MIRPEGTPHNDADEARTLRLDPHPPVAGVDQWARRELRKRVSAHVTQKRPDEWTVCDLRTLGWDVIADALVMADDQFDPDAFLGGVVRGVVAGLREWGVMTGG